MSPTVISKQNNMLNSLEKGLLPIKIFPMCTGQSDAHLIDGPVDNALKIPILLPMGLTLWLLCYKHYYDQHPGSGPSEVR